VGWSRRERGARSGAWVAVLALLGTAGCGPGSPGAAGSASGCGSAPRATAARPLPFSLIDVSAVPGARQAWVLAGRYSDSFAAGNYLLHFSGRNWAKVATFRRGVHLKGVSAVSGSAAWVWGDEGRGDYWPSFRPYLALVSGGVVRPVRAAWLSGVYVTAMAGGGADTWLGGAARDRHGRFLGPVIARWHGTSWYQVPVPTDARAVWSLSTAGPSDIWAVASKARFLVGQWLAHWDGAAWSMAYRPPRSLARDGRVPQAMSVASSPGHAWVTFTEAGTDSGSNATNPPPKTISVYFDGSTWRLVPVPAIADSGLAEITMSGADAWAITAYQTINGILHSHLGSDWCVQRLPHVRHSANFPISISAASPAYVVAVTSQLAGARRRSFAYVYDGHRWQSANSHPRG
jgi:hypothetical protein